MEILRHGKRHNEKAGSTGLAIPERENMRHLVSLSAIAITYALLLACGTEIGQGLYCFVSSPFLGITGFTKC